MAQYPTVRFSELGAIEYQDHCIVAVPGMAMLKQLYQEYSISQFGGSSLVAIFPFYLTAGEVRGALKAGGLDTAQHESQGSLVVSDSRLIHVGLDEEISRLTAKMVWTAAALDKKEISLVVARGSFAILDRVVDRLGRAVRLKGFCAYLQDDLEGLSDEQKRVLFTPRHKILLLARE